MKTFCTDMILKQKKVLFKCNFLLLPLGSQKIEYLKIQKGSVFIGFSLIRNVIVA